MPAQDACEVVQSGSTPAKDRFRSDVGIPYLKIYNIVNQRIDFLHKKQYIDLETQKNLKRSIVKPGDVLMNIVGPPLGKVALVPSTHPEWNINQALVLFRPKAFLSSQFLYYLLCSGLPYSEILNETRGSAGQSNISLSQCREMLLSLPEFEEQQEIVRRVQALFKTADALEARYIKAKAHVDKLTQSILAKAFRGELVAQDPNDQPASVLLERIRKVRAADVNKKVRRTK
ncbi:MAG TPA: restriction endonuclease subunit S [Pyrinomonadaceae bacterium]|nr:restriction endonuclease subunit S [Pyrinomonadaceae bacterium]